MVRSTEPPLIIIDFEDVRWISSWDGNLGRPLSIAGAIKGGAVTGKVAQEDNV